MSSKELATKQEDEKYLREWRQLNPQTKQLFNRIVLDNKKIIEKNGKDEFNDDFGKLYAITYNEEQEEQKKEIDIKTAKFFIAKSRVFPKGKYNKQEKRSEFYCRETDEFDLVEVFDGATKEQVAHDEWKVVKEKYSLTYRQAIYVYYEGLIYRWVISGAHFDSFFEIKNKLTKSRDYQDPHYVRVKSINEVKEDKDGTKPTFPYNSITFEIGEKCSPKLAVESFHIVNDAINDYQKNRDQEQLPPATQEDLAFQ